MLKSGLNEEENFNYRIINQIEKFKINEFVVKKVNLIESVINYNIEVKIDKDNIYYIARRYSDFFKLYKNLLKHTNHIVPYFPQKDIFIKFTNDKNLIEKRKKDLEIFLNKIYTNNKIINTIYFKEFIEKINLEISIKKSDNISSIKSKLVSKFSDIYNNYKLSSNDKNTVFDLIREERNMDFDTEFNELKNIDKIKSKWLNFKKLNYNIKNLYNSLKIKFDSGLLINSDINSIIKKLNDFEIDGNIWKKYEIKNEKMGSFKNELKVWKKSLKNIISECNHILYQINFFENHVKKFQTKINNSYDANNFKKYKEEIEKKFENKIKLIFQKPIIFNKNMNKLLEQLDNEEKIILDEFSQIYNNYYK